MQVVMCRIQRCIYKLQMKNRARNSKNMDIERMRGGENRKHIISNNELERQRCHQIFLLKVSVTISEMIKGKLVGDIHFGLDDLGKHKISKIATS